MKQLHCLIYTVLLAAQAAHQANAATILVSPGGATTWHYLDAGKSAPPDWNTGDAQGQGWKTGAAPLGFGDPGITTTLSFGRDDKAKPISAYFRRRIEVADPRQVANLTLDLRRDDGAVVYLNGIEIARSNMPAGAITSQTRAPRLIDGDMELEYERFVLPVAGLPLHPGSNLLAVEVHQVGPTSGDTMFDLALTAYAPGEPLPPDDYPAALLALVTGDAERAMNILLQPTAWRAGQALLAMRVAEVLRAKGGSTGDPRYWRLLERARAEAPDDMDIVHAWIHAHVAARKDLPIRPAPRALPASIDARWRFIADTPDGTGGPLLPRAQLLADVDDLELLLENCYAYLERNGADYRGALDALRASITGDLNAMTFAHRVARLLTIFGDPHSGVQHPDEARVAARFVMDGDRVAVLASDRGSLLDPKHPYVTAINGQPIAAWLTAAERIVSQASPQYKRFLALQQLRQPGAVARQLRIAPAPAVFELTLAAADGGETARVPLTLGSGGPPAPQWPAHHTTLRPDNIGYLRIASMDEGQAFINKLDDSMASFQGTRGLIIDVRGNGGGTQDAIRTILPWLMKPGSPMKIVNVAAYRLPLPLPAPNRGGFLGLDDRGLYPATSPVWNADEAHQVQAFLADWKPAWQLPAHKFSDWHVMAVKGSDTHGSYDRPVIVLQDAEDFSATDNFLGALKGQPNVTLMGGASGGGSGRMAYYTLPHSHLRVTLCQMASFAQTGQTYDGKGVQPDIVMPATLNDQIVGGGDSVLEAAVQRLLQQPAG